MTIEDRIKAVIEKIGAQHLETKEGFESAIFHLPTRNYNTIRIHLLAIYASLTADDRPEPTNAKPSPEGFQPGCFDTCFAIYDTKEKDILRVDDLPMLFSNSGSRDEHMARFASTRYEGIEVDVITALERDSENF